MIVHGFMISFNGNTFLIEEGYVHVPTKIGYKVKITGTFVKKHTRLSLLESCMTGVRFPLYTL